MTENLLNLLHWSWNHPEIAGASLSGIALILIVWLHVPYELVYYWKNGKPTIRPFNVRNELPNSVCGRIAVLRFSWKHGIHLAFSRRIGLTFLEFFLKLLGIPDPRTFSWDGCFAAIEVYPLGHSRREYIGICIARRIWPWKHTKALQHILDENHGYLPGLQEATFLTSLINRLHS